MKLIIDIDESDYERIKDLVANDTRYTTETTVGTAYQVIANGLPYERSQGKWLKHDTWDYSCSVCGSPTSVDDGIVEDLPNFCPVCGTKMEGGVKNG